MKLTKIIASAFILLATSATIFAQTADEIVAKHIEAMGGADKWKALKAMEMKNKYSVKGMDIESKTVIVNGKSLRTDISVMGQEIISAVDGETGWTQQPTMMGGSGEPEDMPGALIKESRKQVNLGGSLLAYKENGSALELVGKEKLEGHLNSEDFFGTEKFQSANLVFKTIADKNNNVYAVTADLTIKGKTNPVTFNISVNGNKATTNFKIDRSKYDIKYGSGSFFDNLGDNAISDNFDLMVELSF